MEAAVNAVVRDKNITEQSEVDAMAKAIEDAIAALQYKDADYTKVDEAIAKANVLKKEKPASTTDKGPQTGDTSNLALWIALLFVSGGAAIGTTVVSRKIHTKKRQNRHLPELAFLYLRTYFTVPYKERNL